MPMSMTHNYIAKDVYKELDQKIQNKLKSHYHDYLIYANGFDVLDFCFDFKKMKKSFSILKYGHICHNVKTNEFLINLIKKIKVSKDLNQFAFLCGLITHYVADSTIHPYVDYKASKILKKHFTLDDGHFMIESYIDNYLINKREKGNYWQFKVYQELDLRPTKDEKFLNFLDSSFKEVFNVSDIGKYYYKSLSNMRSFFHYFRDDSIGLKRGFYLSVNFLAKRIFRDVSYLSYHFKLSDDEYFLNLNHDTWFNLKNHQLISSDSFFDLYEKVVFKAVKMIESVYTYIFLNQKIDLDKLLENRSYSTGLILK